MRCLIKVGIVWLAFMGGGSLAWANEVQPRIIGGEPVVGDEGEFFVALMRKYKWGNGENEYIWEPACGASYIGDGLVLTAAHCISGTEYKILLGDPDGKLGYQSCGENLCEVVDEPVYDGQDLYSGLKEGYESDLLEIGMTGQNRDIFIHKNYDSATFANDIALIRLASPPDGAAVVNLPDNDFSTFYGDTFTVIGLGDTNKDRDVFQASKDLLKVDLPAVSATACANEYSTYDDDVMVCAGYSDGSDGGTPKDSCQGDSGGPLFDSGALQGDYTQYGIVSFGFYCAETYGVYADVYGLKYWIDNVKAYWLDSINFDWSVDFGTAENSMSKTVTWTISNDSTEQLTLDGWNYNSLPAGFSKGTDQCGTTLNAGQSCSISFNANFNSTGTYEGSVFFNIEDKTYELKFDAVVVKPSSTSSRFSGGGSISPWWFLLAAPLALFRRTRKGPLALVLLSTLGLTACSSNPFASEPSEVVFNPTISEQGLEFSVMSNGCTQENHLLLRVKGDEVEVVRTQPDMCRATPQLKRFVMPLPEQESVWQLENPVRYSNRVSRDG